MVGAAGDGVEPAVGAEGLAVALLGIGDEEGDRAVEADLVRLAVGDVVEEDFASGVGGRTFGEFVALGDELPGLVGDEDFLQLRRPGAGLHRFGPVFPEPAHGFGKDFGGVAGVVGAFTPGVIDFVAGKAEGAFHFLIGHPPVAAGDVLIVGAVLEEDADRLGLVLADPGWVVVAAAEADVGADGAEDAGEGVGAFPGGGEGADGTAGGAADAAVVAVVREVDGPAVGGGFLFDLGEDFVEHEADVVIAQAVVLEAAIEAIDGVLGEGLHPAVHDEDADGHRHLLPFDQLVEDGRRSKADAILPDIDARGFGRVVLFWHVDPVVADGAGEDAAAIERVFLNFPPGRPIALRPSVFGFPGGYDRRKREERNDQSRQGASSQHRCSLRVGSDSGRWSWRSRREEVWNARVGRKRPALGN